jgi:hypothetical protein
MAWDSLRDLLNLDIIDTTDHKFVKDLNTIRFPTDILNDKDYIARAGNYLETVGIIEQEMMNKFGEVTVNLRGNIADLISFSYLYKDLKFKEKFNLFKEPLYFNDKPVKSFGFKDRVLNDITVYEHVDRYSVEIPLEDDVMYITQLSHENTLKDLVWSAQELRKFGNKIPYWSINKLEVPCLNLGLLKRYLEVCGNVKNMKEVTLTDAIQMVKFKLNEVGAILESYALIGCSYCGFPGFRNLKLGITFDSPFLIEIYSKKDVEEKDPYFVSYFNTTECMEIMENLNV